MKTALRLATTRRLDTATKGVPHGLVVPVTTAEVGDQGWNLLREDLPFPAAAIRVSALEANLRWMQRYVGEHDVLLAPHGKTTMAPQLFDLQLRHGAWGITVATVHQLRICRQFGVQRVFMANQLIGRQDVRYVCEELSRDPAFEFYCLVDSREGVARLERSVQGELDNPINVLVEVGLPGGRCGCRTSDAAAAVVDAASSSGVVSLRGIECFEGIAAGAPPGEDEAKVDRLLGLVTDVYRYCRANDCFGGTGPALLSAGGSAYFDIVARGLGTVAGGDARVLLRSGCYLTHDSLFYRRLAERFNARSATHGGPVMGLQSALEVWGQVQSVPETGVAIVNVGKRDVSHDIDLPCVQAHWRPGNDPKRHEVGAGWAVRALDDQHAYLRVPPQADVAVGDLVGFGISHPCTTFDKWRLIWLIDDRYGVVGAVWTYF